MSNPTVVHINLLQARAPAYAVGKSLAALLALALAGMAYHGGQGWLRSSEAQRQRDEVALQVRDAKARIAAIQREQAQNAGVLQLRQEVEALKPRAQAARALTEAVHGAEGGRSEAFLQALGALASVKEPGLWLTALSVGEGGRRVEAQGEARNGAVVLRFARRANELLQPLSLRMDGLEMQPLSGAGTQGTDATAVAFRMR
jgi:hypothetical protein